MAIVPQYLELDDDDEVARCEEWLGRAYARSIGVSYPMMPDYWSPGVQPDPAEVAQRYYVRALLKEDEGAGGVIPIDDAVLEFARQAETLDDGTSYQRNVRLERRPYLLLSARGKRAARPKVITIMGIDLYVGVVRTLVRRAIVKP